MISGIIAGGGANIELPPSIVLLNTGPDPFTDTSGWTAVRGSPGINGNGWFVLSTNSLSAWIEQTYNFTPEQLSAIPNGDCQISGNAVFDSFDNDTDNGAIFIVFRNAANNFVGSYLRPFDNYGAAENISIEEWIPVGATKMIIQFLGWRSDGTELSVYFRDLKLDFVVHPTRKHEYLFANQDTAGPPGFTVTSGSFPRQPWGGFAYPGVAGGADTSTAFASRVIVPSANALAGIAKGTAILHLKAYMYSENADDRARIAAVERNSLDADLATLQSGAATIDYDIRGNVFSGSQIMNPATAKVRLIYDMTRHDGAYLDAVISNFCALVEYDKA